MELIIPTSLIVLGSILFVNAVRMLLPAGQGSADAPRSQPPVPANPIFRVMGLPAMVLGVAVVVGGVRQVMATMELPDPYDERGAEAVADAASTVFWGAVILVSGAYLWRGARRRGGKDRGGRLLIIVDYVLIGVAWANAWHLAVDMWNPPTNAESPDPVDLALVIFVAWGCPGAALVRVGTWLADEKILLTATFNQ